MKKASLTAVLGGDSSARNCALAAQLAANELKQPGIRPFAAGNFKHYKEFCYIRPETGRDVCCTIEASANDRTPRVSINMTYLQGADEIVKFMEKRKKADAAGE